MATSEVRQRVRGYDKLKTINLLPGAEMVSLLPLQMSLYFNVFYSPLWFVSSVLTLVAKYSVLATHYQFITILIYVVMVLVETARLLLGYQGNLREKVPELAGFVLLTFLQVCLTLYLLVNINTLVLPLERAVNVPLLALLLAELLLGLRGLQLIVRAQAVKFHLSQFSSIQASTIS